jgi:hypothetical protein
MNRLALSETSTHTAATCCEDIGRIGRKRQHGPTGPFVLIAAISFAVTTSGCQFPGDDLDRSAPRTVQSARPPVCDPLVPSEGCLSWPPAVSTSCLAQAGYPSSSYKLTLPRLVPDHDGNSDQLEMQIFVNLDQTGTAYYFRNGHFVVSVSSEGPPPTLASEEQALVLAAFLSRNALTALGRQPCQIEAVNWSCVICKVALGLSAGAAAGVGAWVGWEVALIAGVSAKTGAIIGAVASESASSTLSQFVSCEKQCERGRCYKTLEECAQSVCERNHDWSDSYGCDFDNVLFPNAPIPNTGEYGSCWNRYDICIASIQ